MRRGQAAPSNTPPALPMASHASPQKCNRRSRHTARALHVHMRIEGVRGGWVGGGRVGHSGAAPVIWCEFVGACGPPVGRCSSPHRRGRRGLHSSGHVVPGPAPMTEGHPRRWRGLVEVQWKGGRDEGVRERSAHGLPPPLPLRRGMWHLAQMEHPSMAPHNTCTPMISALLTLPTIC